MTAVDDTVDNSRVESRGGALLVKYKPIFSRDGKSVLCCCGSAVKVFSVNTGKCISILRGHSDFVTGVALHPKNPLQIYTSSLDRTIVLWDYIDCVQLKTYEVGFPVQSVVISDRRDDVTAYAICQVSKQKYNVKEVKLPKEHRVAAVSSQVVIDSVSGGENCLAVGHGTTYVAGIDNRSLVIYRTKKDSSKPLQTRNKLKFTCVAAHPADACLVTGCEDGTIVVWWNFLSMKSSPVHTSFHHWHSLPVMTLCFTQQGSYLLSGGHECVLVVWQNDMQTTDFLPRLGAPLLHVAVSPDNTCYVTAHQDNMLQIIGNNLKVSQVIQGLTRGYLPQTKTTLQSTEKRQTIKAHPRTGLHLDPRSGALALNGKPGHLQFYKLDTDEQLYNLDIVGQNYVCASTVAKPPIVTDVDVCALSADGAWLVTSQSRDDGLTSAEILVKFWRFDEQKQTYSLNTSVDLPHARPVECARFRPGQSRDDPMAVTTSADGKFKLWRMRDDTDIYRSNTCWDCESVGFYRDHAACAADFSQDGSVLAVAFGDAVTLWNPDTNGLRTTFDCYDAITQLVMGWHDCSHLLVAGTRTTLLVWNLLTCSVLWTVDCMVVTLARDPTSSNMAAFTNERELFVFSPDQPKPLYTRRDLSKHDVTSAIFIPEEKVTSLGQAWMAGARLYFMDADQKLLTFTYGEDDLKCVTVNAIDQSLPRTALSVALSRSRDVTDSRKQSPPKLLTAAGGASKKLLETAPHVLPRISSLCNQFLTSLLFSSGKKIKRDDERDSDSDSMDDADSDDESSSDVAVATTSETSGNNPGEKTGTLSDSEKTSSTIPKTPVVDLESTAAEDFSWLKGAFSSR